MLTEQEQRASAEFCITVKHRFLQDGATDKDDIQLTSEFW